MHFSANCNRPQKIIIIICQTFPAFLSDNFAVLIFCCCSCNHVIIIAIVRYNSSGAPTLSLHSSTSSSLTIEVQLSPDGVPPILSIAVNFTNPPGLVRSVPGPFSPGQMFTTTLSDLEAETEHNFTVFAFNFNGISPASPDTSFRTGMSLRELSHSLHAVVPTLSGYICVTTNLTWLHLCYRIINREAIYNSYPGSFLLFMRIQDPI